MKKLSLNAEYVRRHLFAAAVTASLAVWFGYDGTVRYPATPAAALYAEIEKAEPPGFVDLEAFKRQKTLTQLSFAFLSFSAALVISLRLLSSARFSFSYDDVGFVWKGKRRSFDEIVRVDLSKWEKSRIATLILENGPPVKLDAWHHLGVAEALEALGSKKFHNNIKQKEKNPCSTEERS